MIGNLGGDGGKLSLPEPQEDDRALSMNRRKSERRNRERRNDKGY